MVPLEGPVDATVRVPGSKSLTNRALVCAALADGRSVIDGALIADDTEAMIVALQALGAGIEVMPSTGRMEVVGTGGTLRPGPIDLNVHQSGTTARFLLPVVALGAGRYLVDGAPSLRARPMGPALAAIRGLGATVEPGHTGGSDAGVEPEDAHAAGAAPQPGDTRASGSQSQDQLDSLPVVVVAPGGLEGGKVAVAGDVSSQFLSGLLLAAPYTRGGVRVEVTTQLVSRPYVDLTVAVMAAFRVAVERRGDAAFVVPVGRYRATTYWVEPDASSASYFLAAAAICGGRVTIEGLGASSVQGDARFADLLARMGVQVERAADRTTVVGPPGRLRGLGDIDLRELPDMAPTLAAVAVFADRPTQVRGVGFIRHHETDRIAAVVRELRRCGIDADEEPDGFVVRPGRPRPARIATYDDHRMAMSFALLGLRAPGIEIANPNCVAKTFPTFWQALDGLYRAA